MSNKDIYISDYKIINKINEGASGIVYLVEKENKLFALKHLKSADAEALVRFRRESSALARLNHKNLVKVYDVGESGEAPFLVMDYLNGSGLDNKLKVDGIFSQEKAIETIVSLASALTELHRINLIHRDIKPPNIYFDHDGTVKLIDFGLVGEVDKIKLETSVVGTPIYSSPEQVKLLKRPVDFRSDLYSLGVVFFEVLVGRPPFVGGMIEILNQLSSIKAPDVRSLNSEVSPAVSLIIQKLLSKDPDDRYSTTLNLINDLNRIGDIDLAISKGLVADLDKRVGHKFNLKTNFVDRPKELNQILRSWQKVKEGRSCVDIVIGPSGIGKSRLCAQFVEALGTQKLSTYLILSSKCQFFDASQPFAPLREAIDFLLEETTALPALDQKQIIEKIKSIAKGNEAHLSRFSKNLGKLFEKTETQKVESGFENDKERFFNCIAEFFVELSKHWSGTVFIVDDLQWIDKSTLSIFQRIFEISKNEAFFLLGTARDDFESSTKLKEVQDSLASYLDQKIEVKGLSEVETATLINNYLGLHEIDLTISRNIFQKSLGNPFVALEYLRVFIDQGALLYRGGAWQVETNLLGQINLSTEVYDLILKRIEKKSSDLKKFLNMTALYRSSFSQKDFAEILGFDSDKLNAILSEANDIGLLEKIGLHKLKFAHDKFTESLCLAIPTDLARNYCDQIAAFYEKKPEKSQEEIFALAYLHSQGNSEKNVLAAIKSNLLAGQLALENHAHEEAMGYLQFAYQLAQKNAMNQNEDFKQINYGLAVCATMLAKWDLAEECSEAFSSMANQAEQLKSLTLRLWVLKNRGSSTAAWEYFRKATEHLGCPYPSYLHWKLLNLCLLAFFVFLHELTGLRAPKVISRKLTGDNHNGDVINIYVDALLCAEYRVKLLDMFLVSFKMLVHAQINKYPKELALGYANVGLCFGIFHLRALAVSFTKKSVKRAEATLDPYVLAFCLARQYSAAIYSGVLLDGTAIFNKHRTFFKKYLNPAELGRLFVTQTVILNFRGKSLEAIQHLSTFLDFNDLNNSKVGSLPMVGAVNNLWAQYTFTGKSIAAQKIKDFALILSNQFRFVPTAYRLYAQQELLVQRYHEELGSDTDDLLDFYDVRNHSYEPLGNLIFSSVAFLEFQKLNRAKNEEEVLSLSRTIKNKMHLIHLSLFCPIFRVNYYFLKARYARIKKNYKRAEKLYKLTEAEAISTDNSRILCEVAIDRARMARDINQSHQVTGHLLLAFQILAEQGWTPVFGIIKKEFKDFIEKDLPYFYTQLSQHGFSDGSDHSTRAFSTVMETRSHAENKSQIETRTVLGGGNIEEKRFLSALIKVSRSFIESRDTESQYREVLLQIVKLFGAERGFLFFKSKDGTQVELSIGINSLGDKLAEIGGFSSTIVKRVFKTEKPIVVAGTDEAEALGSESAVLNNLRSIMATPLNAKDELLGVVYLDSSLAKGLFSQGDLALFSTLANHISVSFELSRIAKIEFEKLSLTKELEIQETFSKESKKVKVLVDNMKQALFAVDNRGIIIDPVSKYSEKVLGLGLAGKNIRDVLYSNIGSEKQANLDSALSTVFDENEIQWTLMADNFPERVKFKSSTDNYSSLKVTPTPIWNEEKNLSQIMFVIEDITEFENLQKNANEHQSLAAIFEEVLETDVNQLSNFVTQTVHKLHELRKLVFQLSDENAVKILRELHTLKGNARLFKLKQLSTQIHESESSIDRYQKSDHAGKLEGLSSVILEEIMLTEEACRKYQIIFQKIHANNRKGAGSQYNSDSILELHKIIGNLDGIIPANQLQQLKQAIKKVDYVSFKSLALPFQDLVTELSKQLNKQVSLKIEDSGFAALEPSMTNIIRDCLNHIIRNAIDHGLEEPKLRLENKKPAGGFISLTCLEKSDSTIIVVKDDGRGIDPTRLAKKALEKNILTQEKLLAMSEDDILNLIFAPQFSTSESVTEISGRGLGLDIVKSELNKIGGTITVESQLGKGCTFIITLSKESAIAVATA